MSLIDSSILDSESPMLCILNIMGVFVMTMQKLRIGQTRLEWLVQ